MITANWSPPNCGKDSSILRVVLSGGQGLCLAYSPMYLQMLAQFLGQIYWMEKTWAPTLKTYYMPRSMLSIKRNKKRKGRYWLCSPSFVLVIKDLLLTSFVTRGRLLNPSEPVSFLFLPSENKGNNSTHFRELLWGLNEIKYLKQQARLRLAQ